jgi:hypothetical protein
MSSGSANLWLYLLLLVPLFLVFTLASALLNRRQRKP